VAGACVAIAGGCGCADGVATIAAGAGIEGTAVTPKASPAVAAIEGILSTGRINVEAIKNSSLRFMTFSWLATKI
jgi:hypothetical protein